MSTTGKCITLNIDLLAAFAGDVDLQGGRDPGESPDSGQHFAGSQKLNLRRCQRILPVSPDLKAYAPLTHSIVVTAFHMNEPEPHGQKVVN